MPLKVDATLRPLHVNIYNALREYHMLTGKGPSKYELMCACRCSTTSIYKAERELKQRGYIESPKFQERGMKPIDMELMLAVEEPDPWETIDLDEPKFFRIVRG